MAQAPARFTLPGDPGSRPWGTMTGTAVRDGIPVIVTTECAGGIPVARLTQPEAMRAAAFMGWGKRLRTVHANKAATFGAWVTAHHAGTMTPDPEPTTPRSVRRPVTDPTPTPDPTPDPTPEPTMPTPTPTIPDGVPMIPATVNGQPVFLTPDDIRGPAPEPTVTIQRVQVITPDRTTDLPDYHHPLLPRIVRTVGAMLGTAHGVLLVGPAGTGKTTMGEQVGDALGIQAIILPSGPADLPSKWFGFVDANGNYQGTAFRSWFEHGGIGVFDELDSGNPACATALNACLALRPGGTFWFPDGPVVKHDHAYAIGTANTWMDGGDPDYARQAQDVAVKDRFPNRFEVPYSLDTDRAIGMQYATTPDLERTISRWIDYCFGWRDNVNQQRVRRIVCSARVIESGARLLASGFTPTEVLEQTLHAGVDPDLVRSLTPNVTF